MQRAKVPSPEFKVFKSYQEGYQFLSNHDRPVVVKADGLASGKGAFVCQDQEASINALYDCMEDRIFGGAGSTVVVEEQLSGREISVFAFSDGEHVSNLTAACDYKRLLDGNRGPNTGGMGSFTPADMWSEELSATVRDEMIEPIINALAESGTPYKGVLYAGIMLTENGPKVLEFNCRFGDPETQVLLPTLNTDLVDIMFSTINGQLHKCNVDWGTSACVGVVMASRGYPGEFRRGLVIRGLDTLDEDSLVFHAGTQMKGDTQPTLFTSGGRVLTVVGTGSNLIDAREHVYLNVNRITFQGSHHRKDIALVDTTADGPFRTP